ncbi:unnamed protein product [Scytosiphon promiscuus]
MATRTGRVPLVSKIASPQLGGASSESSPHGTRAKPDTAKQGSVLVVPKHSESSRPFMDRILWLKEPWAASCRAGRSPSGVASPHRIGSARLRGVSCDRLKLCTRTYELVSEMQFLRGTSLFASRWADPRRDRRNPTQAVASSFVAFLACLLPMMS